MKKSFFILGLSSLLFASCTSEGFEPLAEDFFLLQLAGTWTASEVVTTGCKDDKENGARTCDLNDCLILTIEPGGSYTLIDNFEFPSVTERGTVSVEEELIVFCPTSSNDCEENQYLFSDDTLTISHREDETECNFVLIFSRD